MMKPELFLLGFMDIEVEKKYGKLILYMVTVARLVYAQRWKSIKYSQWKTGL